MSAPYSLIGRCLDYDVSEALLAGGAPLSTVYAQAIGTLEVVEVQPETSREATTVAPPYLSTFLHVSEEQTAV